MKKGISTTLPVALGRLQALREIHRIPMDGRLDQQRYRYTRWTPNPLAKLKLSPEEAQTELARRYFTWIGPATLVEFQWFSALAVKAAKAAIAPLGLVPLAPGGDRMLFPADRDALAGSSLSDLPSHGIFDRGRLIGLWEYDVPRQSVAWTAFIEPDAALKKAVSRMEEFVRTQLGDARSFSLDSPKSREPRVEALRKVAAS